MCIWILLGFLQYFCSSAQKRLFGNFLIVHHNAKSHGFSVFDIEALVGKKRYPQDWNTAINGLLSTHHSAMRDEQFHSWIAWRRRVFNHTVNTTVDTEPYTKCPVEESMVQRQCFWEARCLWEISAHLPSLTPCKAGRPRPQEGLPISPWAKIRSQLLNPWWGRWCHAGLTPEHHQNAAKWR